MPCHATPRHALLCRGMVWRGVVWCDTVRCGAVRCGAVLRCATLHCAALFKQPNRCWVQPNYSNTKRMLPNNNQHNTQLTYMPIIN